MIKQLRKKFIFTAMVAITVLIVIIIGTINVFNVVITDNQTDRTLDFITRQSFQLPAMDKPLMDGKGFEDKRDFFDKPMNEDTFMASRWFVVYFSGDETVKVDVGHISSVDEATALQMARELIDDNKSAGFKDGFKFVSAVVDVVTPTSEPYDSVMVFLDVSNQTQNMLSVLVLSVIIAVIAWALMLLLVVILSEKAIRPISENMEQQKKFITNAGHEIKTPLAIILANTDALELHGGESKWSQNIRMQTKRLNGLMQNLLLLSKMDEAMSSNVKKEINLSEVLKSVIESYQEPAELHRNSIKLSVEDGVIFNEVTDSFRQIFEILVDNAVKYAVAESEICVDLFKHSGEIVFKVKNRCDKLPQVEPEKLFDRFYRGDSARTQSSGGYGIGLSVAKAAVEVNNGKISANYCTGNEIEFVVTI